MDELARQHEEADVVKVPMVRNPHEPTQGEVGRHNLTHANFKPWGPHCQAGLAQRDKHMRKDPKKKSYTKRKANGDADVPDIEAEEGSVMKLSMGYMKFGSKDDHTIPYSLALVHHNDGGFFAHSTPSKGIQGESYWCAKRVAKDIDGCGAKDAKVQVMNDQEPAIVALQEEVRQLRRSKTFCVNSIVGESESNGRVENAIRQVQAKVRTLRSFIGSKLKTKIDLNSAFGTWLIRHSAEILTKFKVGTGGKTAWRRRRGEDCDKPLAICGEKVMYLPLKTATSHADKGEPQMYEGIWLGVNSRTEEVLIGTRRGVVKCRTTKRLPEGQRWDATLVREMKGTHWQPVPGHLPDHTPVEIKEDGSKAGREEEDDDPVSYKPVPLEEDVDKTLEVYRSRNTGTRVAHNDIGKYGATPGCIACRHFTEGNKLPYGVMHSKACTQRIQECIEAEGGIKDRVSRAKARQSKGSLAVEIASSVVLRNSKPCWECPSAGPAASSAGPKYLSIQIPS